VRGRSGGCRHARMLASRPMPPLSAPTFIDQPLPYVERLARRLPGQVDLVVVHCTELPDLATAREYGERVLYASGGGISGHFNMDHTGYVLLYVPVDRVAHHVRGWNDRAIGIEQVNRGRWPDWLDSRRQAMDEPYPEAQVRALVALLRQLALDLPALRYITGHEDLDREQVPASDDPALRVQRQLDPGPRFPWEQDRKGA